jgi:hypothetical protein
MTWNNLRTHTERLKSMFAMTEPIARQIDSPFAAVSKIISQGPPGKISFPLSTKDTLAMFAAVLRDGTSMKRTGHCVGCAS